ncbi:fibronectin type III domain-containing protein [candidate division KSB1 bacterium]|nr:fibronectin type III domain-containing protein [candidate division KSB1 bacterium]
MFEKKYNKYSMKTFLYTLLFVVFLFHIRAANSAGYGFHFLNRIYSPRIGSLSGANTTVYGDINGIFINPAGLAYIENQQLCLNYVSHLLDMQGGMLGFNLPVTPWGNLSFGIVHFDYGEFEEIDKFGIYTGRNFNAKDIAMAASYSYPVNEHFAFAVTAKYIFSELDQYRANAAAFDTGLLYRPSFLNGSALGIALLNLGNNFDPYRETKEDMPLTLSAGVSLALSGVPATLFSSFNHQFGGNNTGDPPLTFSAGSEISILEKLYLRAGYNYQLSKNLVSSSNNNFAGFSFGFGLNLENNSLDYSFTDYGALGMVHHFGVTFNLQKPQISKIPAGHMPAFAVQQLNPPKNIKTALVKDNIYIAWEAEKEAAYNIYTRHSNGVNWVRINKKPLRRNWVKLKRPEVRGSYEFAVTTLKPYIDYTESALSGSVTVHIK